LNLTAYVSDVRTLAGEAKTPGRAARLNDYADFIQYLTEDRELVRRRFFLAIPYVGYSHNPTQAEIRRTLLANAQDLAERLKRCGVAVIGVDKTELANVFHAMLRPALAIDQYITAEDLEGETFLNLVAPDGLDFAEDHSLIGSRFTRVLQVINYRHEVTEGWLSNLYSYSPNVAIIQHVEPTTADDLQREISNSLGEIRHQLNKGAMSPLEAKQAELKEQSADYLLTQLASGSQEVLDFCMYLQISADSKAELDALSTKMERMLGADAMKTRRTRHTSHQALDTALPVCINRLKENTSWQMPAETVASTFAFDHAELSHTTGVLRGINKYTRNATIIDPYHRTLVNPHEVSIMTSGAGKSIEMKANLDRSHAMGDRIFLLDIEREYQDLTIARGGQWINLAPGGGNVINPLEIRPTDVQPDYAEIKADCDELQRQVLNVRPPFEHANQFLAGLSRQQTLFDMMLPGMSEVTMAYVEEAQFQVFQDAGIDEDTDLSRVGRTDWPHIGHLSALLLKNPHTQELGMVMQRWYAGTFRGIISGHSTVDLNSSWVCFDIHDLEGLRRAQPVALYTALTYLWDECRRNRAERKTLAIDELGLIRENPDALWFAWMVSKRGRKYSLRLKTATQQIKDFLEGGFYAQAILSNADTKILGRTKEDELAKLKDLIPFSEQELNLLATMPQNEKLLLVGNQRVVVDVAVSRDELKVYDKLAYLRVYEPEEYERLRRQGGL
jgi:hypothetical protein